jgi:hypothetical protein
MSVPAGGVPGFLNWADRETDGFDIALQGSIPEGKE